jgi:hypothetical protein
MSFAPPSIPLPRGVALEIGPLWDVLAAALTRLLTRFGPVAALVRGNGPPAAALRVTLIALKRLEQIARFVLIVYAAQLLKLDPKLREPPKARAPSTQVRPKTVAQWRTMQLLPPPSPDFVNPKTRPAPPPPKPGARHTIVRLARKLEGLRRLLAHADHHARRLARLLRRWPVFVRRPARRARGPYGAEVALARSAASWALRRENTS